MNPTTQAISVPPPALNTNGPRQPRTGPAMADWRPPQCHDSARSPAKVYKGGLRRLMRIHRESPARAARLLLAHYRPGDVPEAIRDAYRRLSDNPTDPAAVLTAYRAVMAHGVFPRFRWEFPTDGDTLAKWERSAGRIVGADHERLSGCGRRGAARSAAVRRSRRRPRDAAIWRWYRDGRGTLVIMADVAADWPELTIGPRRIQQIVREREQSARCRRDTKAARTAERRRRERTRRDSRAAATVVQRVRAAGDTADEPSARRRVDRVARSVGVSRAFAWKAIDAARAADDAAERAAERAFLESLDRPRRRPRPEPLWKWCVGAISPRGELYDLDLRSKEAMN